MTTLSAMLALRAPTAMPRSRLTAVYQQLRSNKMMIDPMDHCTGVEKREKLAHKAGIKDPFDMQKLIERGPGTKECPNLIPSANDARMVGCICHPEQRFAVWMWLVKDMPKRCECGHWFKLVQVPPF